MVLVVHAFKRLPTQMQRAYDRLYNDTPYAYDASFSILHDREFTGQLCGYDPDGDAITAQLISGPSNASLTFNPDGSFSYIPNTHSVGPDSFTYTWSDGLTSSNSATVSIDVYDNAPYAYSARFSALHGRQVTGQLDSYDVDGGVFSRQLVSDVLHSRLTLHRDDTFIDIRNTHHTNGWLALHVMYKSRCLTQSFAIHTRPAVGWPRPT